MNKLREIVSERPMSSARVFHILTVRVKKDLVALERTRLVGITIGLTLTSPVTELKKKTLSRYSCQ